MLALCMTCLHANCSRLFLNLESNSTHETWGLHPNFYLFMSMLLQSKQRAHIHKGSNIPNLHLGKYVYAYTEFLKEHIYIRSYVCTVQREYLAVITFGKFTCFEHLGKKVWRMNRFSQKVIIISRNLGGFSLANQGWFVKFTKLSVHQTFLLYGTYNYFSLLYILMFTAAYSAMLCSYILTDCMDAKYNTAYKNDIPCKNSLVKKTWPSKVVPHIYWLKECLV